jgi:hypothetical protein
MSMTLDDISDLLTFAAASDKRSVGKLDIAFWHQAVGDLDFEACAQAVVRHYSTSTAYLMPVHIRALVADQERLPAAIAYAEPEHIPEAPAARNQRPDETRAQWMARLQTQNADWYRKHNLHRDATDAEVRAAEGSTGRRSKPWTPHDAA